MIAENSASSRTNVAGSCGDTSDTSSQRQNGPAWVSYPFSLPTYNPLTEWGEHYQRILQKNLWAKQSSFLLQELRGNFPNVVLRAQRKLTASFLEDDPEVRIFYCDSKLCSDLVTRASFTAEDIKKIFFKYNLSVVFLDRFVGRNRCMTGSRKTRDHKSGDKVVAYDIWYDIPCRIFNSEREYDLHFVLFTVYVHYDVVAKKTAIFYIHRLGSEQACSAEASSRQLKSRVRSALEYMAGQDDHLAVLQSSPFLMQLPTITSCTTFWTETLHIERLDMWKKEDEGKEDLSKVNILALHNDNRYVQSYFANIQIVQQTLDFVAEEHTWFVRHIGHETIYPTSPWFETTSDCLRSHRFQMQVILIWAEEVLKRNTNLINLYFNRVSHVTSRTTAKIAQEAKYDAISMRTVALVTLFSLPATLVSSVFAMPFSQELFNNISLLWVYFLISVSLTFSVLVTWSVWLRQRMKVVRHREREDFIQFS